MMTTCTVELASKKQDSSYVIVTSNTTVDKTLIPSVTLTSHQLVQQAVGYTDINII